MIIESVLRGTNEILNGIDLYQKQENSEIRKVLLRHSLIVAYTTYESAVKEIVQENYHRYESAISLEFILNTSIKRERWTPDVKHENLKKIFPLLKDWFLFDELSNIDSLINARHAYAHGGATAGSTVTMEDVAKSYIMMSYIILFLEHFYYKAVVDIAQMSQILKNYTNYFQVLPKQLRECGRIISHDYVIPSELNQRYTKTLKELCRPIECEMEIPEYILIFAEPLKCDVTDASINFHIKDTLELIENGFDFFYNPSHYKSLNELEEELKRIITMLESVQNCEVSQAFKNQEAVLV